MKEWNIDLEPGGPNPASLKCDPGDKITWTNKIGKTITGFTLPTCVSPQKSPAPIVDGKTTRTYNVNNDPSGSYEYSYTYPDTPLTTKNGTIDVGAK